MRIYALVKVMFVATAVAFPRRHHHQLYKNHQVYKNGGAALVGFNGTSTTLICGDGAAMAYSTGITPAYSTGTAPVSTNALSVFATGTAPLSTSELSVLATGTAPVLHEHVSICNGHGTNKNCLTHLSTVLHYHSHTSRLDS